MNFYVMNMKYEVRIIVTFNVNLFSASLCLCTSIFLKVMDNVVSSTQFAASKDRMFSE